MTDAALITGADGYLGRRIASRFLEDTKARTLLWVRAGDADEFQAKRAALERTFSSFGERVTYAHGDLVEDSPFEGVDTGAVRWIVHAAAVTRFNVDEETARRVNIEGTEKLLRFAARCGGLERLGLLSTIYASGLRPGRILETPLPAGSFANHYESSKWAAEALLLEGNSALPWRIFRVATVIADDESGRVSQFNAVHNTLQLLYYGLITTLPGRAETPLYLVTGDFVARSVCALMSEASSNERIFHLCHRREQSLTLDEFVTRVYEVFEQDEFFRKRRTPRPLYMDEESFEILRQALSSFAGGVVNQAVGSVAPFARQLFITKEFDNSNLIAALRSDPTPDPAALAREASIYLIRSKWGRVSDHAA